MIVFGIISEYNPMHNGHIYQIQRIKTLFPEAYIISLTSGSFVQRGEPSFISKHSKSNIAVDNGIDLLIEMPTIISIQSANYFSFYSVKLLNKLNILTHLSFGVENIEKNTIEKYIFFSKNNKNKLDNLINQFMKEGNSYKNSNIMAYKNLGFEDIKALESPNNTLGLKYAYALDKLNSPIEIHPINRIDKGYHEDSISLSKYQSSTAIRKAYKDKKDILRYLPADTKKYEKDLNRVDIDDFSDIFYYKAFIKENSAEDIASYENGLLNLLKSNFDSTISQMVEKSHNKRYSKSRLKRFIINYLLNVTIDDINQLNRLNYIKPLAFNDKGRKLLKIIKTKSDINIINSPKEIVDLDDYNAKMLELDLKAFKLFNINDHLKNQLEYKNIPYKKF